MPLTVSLAEGRAAFDESVTAFVDTVDVLSEWDLLGGSRCYGWTRLEVVDHVVAGWHEMLGGFVTPVDDVPSVDAASYWAAFAELSAGFDRLEVLLAQRRRAVAHRRPSALVAQLRDVAASMLSASATLGPGPCRWQGQVFAPGDFLAIWAVEGVVHLLDLNAPAHSHAPLAMALARRTVEALVDIPPDYDDLDIVLFGAGRRRAPREIAGLPVLG